MIFNEAIGQQIFSEWRKRKLAEFVIPQTNDNVLQVVTFSVNQSSLAINDEIRKTTGANLIRTKWHIAKNKDNDQYRTTTKSYYISGTKVNFIHTIPISEKVIQQ